MAPGPYVVPSKLPVLLGKREKDESGARKAKCLEWHPEHHWHNDRETRQSFIICISVLKGIHRGGWVGYSRLDTGGLVEWMDQQHQRERESRPENI